MAAAAIVSLSDMSTSGRSLDARPTGGHPPTDARRHGGRSLRLVDLELDLEVFAGPFDLLLTLILREEVDLLEVDLAEIVISYIDFLEAKGELDLELATEFLVLIAALLELKSRLMLPGEEVEERLDLDPSEAAQELLERLLDAHRYRAAAEHLGALLAAQAGYRFRSAPLPEAVRRATLPLSRAVYNPLRLARAMGDLLTPPPQISTSHIPVVKVSVAERLAHVRALLRRGSFSFDEAVASADRVTVAVTVFALLELYKQGELVWTQDEPFGEITVQARGLTPARLAATG
jgi:segregation and condensation protein A